MSFFKKLFGGNKEDETTKDNKVTNDNKTDGNKLPWIEAADNPWGKRLVDLRPITQTMLSTSTDPQMATNAISYSGEDGVCFWAQKPNSDRVINTAMSFAIDNSLPPGVLFIPRAMEHKWAIYFDGEHLIFVRSWLRQVFVVAKTTQTNNELVVGRIIGEFTPNEPPEFTRAILSYLLISHSIGEIVPAPLPKDTEVNLEKAGRWAFSTYGNMAQVGSFDSDFIPATKKPLRAHSLLHIAVAKNDIAEIETQFRNGTSLDYLAGDGLAPLHWAMATESTDAIDKLLQLGANPNVASIEGATPIMNSAQSNRINHLHLLLKAGASVNARDNRGFTALHRAAEKGYEEIVRILLENGADKAIASDGHTAISFAQNRGHEKIVALLS